MTNDINNRFFKVFEQLKEEGKIKSLKQFSEVLGFPKQYITGYRNGNRKVSIAVINKIASIYGVSLPYLLNGCGSIFETTSSNIESTLNGRTSVDDVKALKLNLTELEHNLALAKIEIESLKRELAIKDKYISLLEKHQN